MIKEGAIMCRYRVKREGGAVSLSEVDSAIMRGSAFTTWHMLIRGY